MKHKTSRVLALIFFLLFSIAVFIAQAQSPQETLNQYISDLQNNPNDNALREKIINYVQGMKEKPALPEDAERHMARGQAAFKDAKDTSGFKEAIAEFERASIVAPWLGNIYYNLGVVQDKAGKYEEAIKNLKLYLLASPDAHDAKKVKDLIYEVEYRKDKAKGKAAATKDMFTAIAQCRADDVRAAIDKGADVNSGEESQVFKITPLASAVDSCSYADGSSLDTAEAGDAIVRLLIEKGADVNAKMPLYADDTALIEAVRYHKQKGGLLSPDPNL